MPNVVLNSRAGIVYMVLYPQKTQPVFGSRGELYSKNQSNLHPVVNGITDKVGIVDLFSSHFSKVSKPNNVNRVNALNDKFQSTYREAIDEHSCIGISHLISLQTVLDAAFSMNKGTSFNDEKLSAKYFFHAPLCLFDRLRGLFNSMHLHGFVPSQFCFGTIIPLVKDRHGDLGDVNNYCGITIAPIVSKICEHVLQITFTDYLSTLDYQFSFKRKSLTSHAIHCLRETMKKI